MATVTMPDGRVVEIGDLDQQLRDYYSGLGAVIVDDGQDLTVFPQVYNGGDGYEPVPDSIVDPPSADIAADIVDESGGVQEPVAVFTAPALPAHAALKGDWVEYAVAVRDEGVSEDDARADAEASTKDELVARFGE